MVEAFLGVQIVSVSFAVFMIYVVHLHFKKNHINQKEFFVWLFLWGALIGFALYPKILDPLLARLFVTRAMDLLMIAAFMILSYLGFQNHIGVKHLQKQINILVRNQALKYVRKKN